MPRVTVVMPVLDIASFVEESLRSVIEQTMTDVEILVIDRGSSDGTPEAAGSVDDLRIEVIRLARAGLAEAKNMGRERARGDYLLVMNGGDVALPRLAEAQARLLDRHLDTAAVGVWTRRFGAEQGLDRPPADPTAIRTRLRRPRALSGPVMYRVEDLHGAGRFQDEDGDDRELLFALARDRDVRVVPDYLALHRIGPHAEPPSISVVVPTLARPQLLKRCLDGILAQDVLPDEIVVAYRPEDEETARLLQGWVDEETAGPRRVAVAVDRPGEILAVNAGIAAATSDVTAFLDDDAIPERGWLAEIRRAFLDPTIGAAGGRVLDHVGGRLITTPTRRVGVVTWYGRIIWGHARECPLYGDVDWLTGANLAIRRELAPQDERLLHQSTGVCIAMDLDATLRVKQAGMRVFYSAWARVEHHTTSFRDPILGGHAAGEDIVSSVANHTYVLLQYVPAWRRPILHLWGYLVGSASQAGPIRIAGEIPRSVRRAFAMAKRLRLVWRGRRLGARMFTDWRRSGGGLQSYGSVSREDPVSPVAER